MRIAVTGFVSEEAGSIASANALLLRDLLKQGWEVTFFSKASFVDPRPIGVAFPNFSFVDVDNRTADRLRQATRKIPGLNRLSGQFDSSSYNRLLVQRMKEASAQKKFDLVLWMGEMARGRVGGIPSVSFAQGAPGTDARSIARHFSEIKQLAGPAAAWKWRLLAQLRLSRLGLPPFQHTDHFIVGSNQSRQALIAHYDIPGDRVSTLPYPIDLDLFQPGTDPTSGGPLRCLWLGRIVPRKRLDLFLDAGAEALANGVDLRLTIVGTSGFIPGYEKLIEAFPRPDCLEWKRRVERRDVPALLRRHDLLMQPSEEEDFGSSVAEAQACGLPVMIGATNGNADYLCDRDMRLPDYQLSTVTHALTEMASRQKQGTLRDAATSRRCAEEHFSLAAVSHKLRLILEAAKS